MAALQQGVKTFTVDVSVMDKPTEFMDFDEIIQLKEFNITTKYRLHDDIDYHSLDEAQTMSVVAEVADHHLIHCGATHKLIKVGDMIVGSSDAAWKKRPFSVKTKHHTGLVYTRRVVAQEAYENNEHTLLDAEDTPQTCVKTTTQEVHPFELFEHFRMVTVAHVPFTYDDFDLSDKTTYQEPPEESTHSEAYKLVHGISTEALPVDAPAQTCLAVRNYYFGGTGGTFHDGTNDDFSMILGYTVGIYAFKIIFFAVFVLTLYTFFSGCVSANMQFSCCSAFTFNYNQNTKAATNSLNLAAQGITGLTCTNCFAYTGAYLMVVMDYYGAGWYMAFEAKVSGALGVGVLFFILCCLFHCLN